MLGFAPALSPTAAEIIKIRQEGTEEADISAWGEGTLNGRSRVFFAFIPLEKSIPTADSGIFYLVAKVI